MANQGNELSFFYLQIEVLDRRQRSFWCLIDLFYLRELDIAMGGVSTSSLPPCLGGAGDEGGNGGQ
ncbi:MAG: hypothetical protein FD153_640, partial [Rhodospirillaceae bacterium]